MSPNLVIRGGFVVDGSGRHGFEADVVAVGDRTAGVGRYDGPADEVIDARGTLVTPGFIDIHTHLDAQITWDPARRAVVLPRRDLGREVRHDFLTAARHLSQRADGYVATIVNGRVVMRDGEHMGALSGRLLRNEAVA